MSATLSRYRPSAGLKRRLREQRGVALLSAILVVAIAVVLVAALLDAGEASRARARNALRAEQTWQLLHGLEGWAALTLQRDDGQVDSRDDPWLSPLPPITVPGGIITGQLVDQSGCFNINSLVVGETDNVEAIERFSRLLGALKLDPTIAQKAADWMDADPTPRSGGAEDAQYQLGQPPYRTAGSAFTHVSELRLLAGVAADDYAVLESEVCAHPPDAPVNLNFASRALWMSLDERITEGVAQRLWQEGRARYREISEVDAALMREQIPGVDLRNFSTSSRYILARAQVESEGIPFLYTSLMERSPAGVRVLARARGRL